MLSLVDGRPGFSRREFLRIGSLGLGGLSLPHSSARAPGCREQIHYHWKVGDLPVPVRRADAVRDVRPEDGRATDGIRSVTGEIPTALPGVTFGSSFPQLAKRANKLAVVRSYVPGREISNQSTLSDRASQRDARCQSRQLVLARWQA